MEVEVVTVGLDLAKNVLQVHAIAADDAVREMESVSQQTDPSAKHYPLNSNI